jgi:hypothetical protein
MNPGKPIDMGAIAEIGFAQGPQKLNDGSGKTNYPGMIDRGSLYNYSYINTRDQCCQWEVTDN